MDFGLDETVVAVTELAEKIFRDFSTPDRLLKLEDAGDRVDLELWAALKDAGILAVGIDDQYGGTGLGFAETCLILEQAGRTVAAVPFLTHGVALQTLQRAGAYAELKKFLDDAGWITASARTDRGNTLRDSAGQLSGSLSTIPYAPVARALIIPAKKSGSWYLYLVPADQPGVRVQAQTGTDQSPMGKLDLDAATATMIGETSLVEWMRQRLIAGSCALQAGVVDEAIRLTAAYVAEREAFGAKIGTFQAVSQRMADAYIDSMALQVMARNAASILARQDEATADVLATKTLAGDVGHRVLASCQHLHGGIGHDRTYTLWRYAVAAKQNELATISSAAATAELGALIAAQREIAVL